jgi:uncharacterized protein (TIGR03067 family)
MRPEDLKSMRTTVMKMATFTALAAGLGFMNVKACVHGPLLTPQLRAAPVRFATANGANGEEADEVAAANDRKELQGEWQAVEVQQEGEKAPAEYVKKFRVVIKNGEITFSPPKGGSRKSNFKLDPSMSPKAIDFAPLDGKHKGKTVPGIYALDGVTLKICVGNSEDDIKARPREFRTQEGDGLGLLILERVK